MVKLLRSDPLRNTAKLESEDYVDKPPELPSISISLAEDEDENEEWMEGGEREDEEEVDFDTNFDDAEDVEVSIAYGRSTGGKTSLKALSLRTGF